MTKSDFAANDFKAIAIFVCAILWSTAAKANCLSAEEARVVVPQVEQTIFPEVHDLRSGAYTLFLRSLAHEHVPPSDEAIVFYRPIVGHGNDILVLWFKDGCAVGKGSYPAQVWQTFLIGGKES